MKRILFALWVCMNILVHTYMSKVLQDECICKYCKCFRKFQEEIDFSEFEK